MQHSIINQTFSPKTSAKLHTNYIAENKRRKSMKKQLLTSLAMGIFLLGVTGMANAMLIGDQIDVTYFNNGLSETQTITVTDDATDKINWDNFIVDVNENNIFIDFEKAGGFASGSGFQGFIFSDLNDPLQIGNIVSTLNPYPGNPVNISMTTDPVSLLSELSIDLSGLSWNDSSELSVELNPTPEPATMLLFGTGLASLAGIRRKRAKKA
jgi:hypothetical protein